MKHKHHILPRHAGGTDDLSNLIELTVAEHAEAHFDLYLTYGREGDRLAYLALSGQADSQWWKDRAKLGGGPPYTPERRKAQSERQKGVPRNNPPRSLVARERVTGYDFRLCWDRVSAAISSNKYQWGNKKIAAELGVSRRFLSGISSAIRSGLTFDQWSGLT